MNQIIPGQVTPAFKALFRVDEPQACRCFVVLEGKGNGKIMTDDAVNPTWGVVWEANDGGIYLGGTLDAATLAQVIAHLRQEGEVLVGLWDGDPRWSLLPPNPYYDGFAVDFYDRPLGEGMDRYLHPIPSGCAIRRLDGDLIMRSEWGPADVQKAGGIEAWLATCLGYCLLRGDELLCEATVGPGAIGLREPGVFTQAAERGKGYATLTCAHLIRALETMGEQTYWNCAKQNLASAAVARKLGYRIEKEYRLVAWDKSG